MTMQRTAEGLAQIRAMDEAQAEQERKHAADPYHELLYLPVDAEGFESEAWTAGWQDED